MLWQSILYAMILHHLRHHLFSVKPASLDLIIELKHRYKKLTYNYAGPNASELSLIFFSYSFLVCGLQDTLVLIQ